MLENSSKKLNKSILDIGGAAKPHCSLVDLKDVNEYWVSAKREVYKKNINLSDYGIKKHIYDEDSYYNYFPEQRSTFSSIIASHIFVEWKLPWEPFVKVGKFVR